MKKVHVITELDLDSERADVIAIMILLQEYSKHLKELLQDEYELEDTLTLSERMRAIKCLLEYYMIPSDYKRFIKCIAAGEPFTFDESFYYSDDE